MSIELNQITDRMHQRCLNISPDKEKLLHKIINLGNTYVDLISILIESYAKPIDKLLISVLDEFFVDVHVSVALATGEHYKSGCVVLRSAIELGLYLLYFIDHPIEAKLWSDSGDNDKNNDMSFFQILEKICNHKYLKLASGRDVDGEKINNAYTNLSKQYRSLSERVHGKYKFLQYSNDDTDIIFNSFCEAGIESLKAVLLIASERAENTININELIPTLRSV